MTFESHNPATGELVGTYPEHDAAETDLQVSLTNAPLLSVERSATT